MQWTAHDDNLSVTNILDELIHSDAGKSPRSLGDEVSVVFALVARGSRGGEKLPPLHVLQPRSIDVIYKYRDQ
jgi:hypothetical protein